MSTENEQIVERVMRMGIEARASLSANDLWNLASKQLKDEEKKRKQQSTPTTLQDWFRTPVKYAFMYINGQLQVVRVTDTTAIKIIEMRSSMPVIEI